MHYIDAHVQQHFFFSLHFLFAAAAAAVKQLIRNGQSNAIYSIYPFASRKEFLKSEKCQPKIAYIYSDFVLEGKNFTQKEIFFAFSFHSRFGNVIFLFLLIQRMQSSVIFADDFDTVQLRWTTHHIYSSSKRQRKEKASKRKKK